MCDYVDVSYMWIWESIPLPDVITLCFMGFLNNGHGQMKGFELFLFVCIDLDRNQFPMLIIKLISYSSWGGAVEWSYKAMQAKVFLMGILTQQMEQMELCHRQFTTVWLQRYKNRISHCFYFWLYPWVWLYTSTLNCNFLILVVLHFILLNNRN